MYFNLIIIGYTFNLLVCLVNIITLEYLKFLPLFKTLRKKCEGLKSPDS